MKIQTLIRNAEKSKLRHDTHCGELCIAVLDLLLDDCPKDDMSVFYQTGDGLVLSYDRLNVPVDSIVSLYEDKGLLSWADVQSLGT